MPKPKWERKDIGFEETNGDSEPLPQRNVQQGKVPHIPVSALNTVYETGARGFPNVDFVSDEEKRIEELEGQLAQMAMQLQGQTSDLAVQDGSLLVHGFQLSPTGLIAPESVNFESWEQVGHLLFRLEGSIQWLIGDWLLYGDQVEWGKTDEIAQALGREAQTLYHYKSICQTFEFCRRRQNLSFGHHDAVRGLSIEEQDASLNHAEAEGLSVSAFRKWLRAQAQQGTPSLSSSLDYDFDTPSRGFKKFWGRDPSTLKPKERAEVIGYMTELERLLADYKRRMGNA